MEKLGLGIGFTVNGDVRIDIIDGTKISHGTILYSPAEAVRLAEAIIRNAANAAPLTKEIENV